LFKRQFFQRYDFANDGVSGQKLTPLGGSPVLLQDCTVFATADTAMTARKENDWTVFAVWALARTSNTRVFQLFLLDVIRRHEEGPDHLPTLRHLFHAWPQLAYALIESKADGLTLLQAAKREGLRVRPFQPQKWGDKYARAEIAAGFASAGRLLLPRSAHWLPEWEDEHLAFPTARHDDQVDATSMAAIELLKWEGPSSDKSLDPTEARRRRDRELRGKERRGKSLTSRRRAGR
jgi:predicted phage terminase large subunit-like protein